MTNFGDLSKDSGLSQLNAFLESRSYLVGYVPSQADVATFGQIGGKAPDGNRHPHVARWYRHIASYSSAEQKAFGNATVTASVTTGAVPKKAAAADDDDLDLFGSDEEADEEAERVREERLKAYAAKKAKKPGPIAKSNVILDVKPWDDETDLKALEDAVRSISMEGLVWGISKLMPVGYGIHKLQIVCVVEDEKVSIDELSEKITEFEDFVQSVDVAAFQKI